ncbi:MerR family transcriptional regulator [Shewanella algae]|uniref:MerR family transcriptional regulator n=1 Tax=Shewanella algae TaxID=38313 RepID=UPI0021D5A79C|nr:MerR family transcriptional regulator [Shewanella algae]
MTRTISKVAKELAINIETVRFYERRGLIEQPPKPELGYRHYPDETVNRIRVSVHFRTSYSHLRSRDKLCTHHYRRVIWQSELTATLHNGSN